MQLTQHAVVRMQQRGIPLEAVEALMEHGNYLPCRGQHGNEIVLLSRRFRRSGLCANRRLAKVCKGGSQYLVIHDDTVITVGHRTKKIRRH